MCAKFNCHSFSSLENTRVGQICPPPSPQIKYATPDTPNKIALSSKEFSWVSMSKIPSPNLRMESWATIIFIIF